MLFWMPPRKVRGTATEPTAEWSGRGDHASEEAQMNSRLQGVLWAGWRGLPLALSGAGAVPTAAAHR
jgi:hypothetical protein